jgi:hypothetical protein
MLTNLNSINKVVLLNAYWVTGMNAPLKGFPNDLTDL